MTTPVVSSLGTALLILAAMAVVAMVETVVPLHARARWYKAHLKPNLTLTFLTFATNVVFNAALVAALLLIQERHAGLLERAGFSALVTAIIAVIALDFSFFAAHRAMHRSALLWRFHAVHHSDPAVDVTTTIRQHPGESVIRYGFMAACALAIGAPVEAFAIYRIWSALQGLVEHANVRMPRRLDTLLSLVVTTPNMHKVHHSRAVLQTNTNFGNLFSVFDRLCSTFTPSVHGTDVAYGLEGFDDEALQATTGLLMLPFRRSIERRTAPGPEQMVERVA